MSAVDVPAVVASWHRNYRRGLITLGELAEELAKLDRRYGPQRLHLCRNCGEPIRESFPGVWAHPTHGNHTVCDWREGMAPTTRVAAP